MQSSKSRGRGLVGARVTSAIRPGMPRRDSLRFVGGALARAHPTWRGFCNDLCNGSRLKCDRATRKLIFIIIHTAHTYMHIHGGHTKRQRQLSLHLLI
jgi:hypothetical protein